MFGEVAAKPRRVQSFHPRSILRLRSATEQRSILARRINIIGHQEQWIEIDVKGLYQVYIL